MAKRSPSLNVYLEGIGKGKVYLIKKDLETGKEKILANEFESAVYNVEGRVLSLQHITSENKIIAFQIEVDGFMHILSEIAKLDEIMEEEGTPTALGTN